MDKSTKTKPEITKLKIENYTYKLYKTLSKDMEELNQDRNLSDFNKKLIKALKTIPNKIDKN